MLARVLLGPRPSLHHLRCRFDPVLFGDFTATMTRSDFSRPCIIGFGSSPSRCGPVGSSALWPGLRPLRFRRIPFRRDVAFDPGGASASRIAMPHMLPSTIMNASASASFRHFVAQSHTPSDRCVRFAPAVTGDYATLTTRQRADHFTGAGLSPAGTRQLFLTHHNRRSGKSLFDHPEPYPVARNTFPDDGAFGEGKL